MEFFESFLNPDTIHSLTMQQKMISALMVTLIGMGVTFVGLIVIQYLMKWTSVVVRGVELRVNKPVTIEKSPAVQPGMAYVSPVATISESEEITEELVAIITAAIAASMGTATSNIVVHNIRRVGNTSPAWAMAGRNDQLGGRF